jgi:hypothetical protein
MMNELMIVNLDERAIQHASSILVTGFGLARELAGLLSGRGIKCWTLLPIYTNPNQVYKFEMGYICDIDTSEEIAKFVQRYSNDYQWIIEDNIAKAFYSPKENSIDDVTFPFYVDNEVYHLLDKTKMSWVTIRETFMSGGAYPFVGILTQLGNRLENKILKNEVLREDLMEIARQTALLVLKIYDEEAFLILELDPNHDIEARRLNGLEN